MGKVPPSGQDTRSVASAAGEVNTQADLAGARADLADEMDALEIEMPDGTTATFREILDDLDADDALVRAIDACSISTRGD